MRPADKSPYERAWQSTLQEMGTPLREIEFVVVDLETSGAAPHLGAGITEIAAVRIQGGEIKDTFTTLINPGHPIPRQITNLTGIDAAMVEDAPDIGLVLDSLIEFIGDKETVFVAQNAPFDLSFLKAAARAHGKKWPKQRILDTAILARKILTTTRQLTANFQRWPKSLEPRSNPPIEHSMMYMPPSMSCMDSLKDLLVLMSIRLKKL